MKFLILLCILNLSFVGCASNGGLTTEQQSQLITAGTDVATQVLQAWLISEPFGGSKSAHPGNKINNRDVDTFSDQEILASMKQARAAVRAAQPKLSYYQADKIVRDVYVKKFGERVRKLRYHS